MVDIGIESAQSVLGEVTSHLGLGLERYTELNQIHHSAWIEEASNHVGIVRGKLGARWAMVYTSFIEMARGHYWLYAHRPHRHLDTVNSHIR